MTPDQMIALVSVLFGSGALGVIVKAILDRKKSPLDRTHVLTAAAESNVTAALAIASEARDIAKTAQERAEHADTRSAEANSRSEMLENEVVRLRTTLRALRDWAGDIVRNWETIRHHDAPPTLPPEADPNYLGH